MKITVYIASCLPYDYLIMKIDKYISEIEKQIAEHQRTQMANPPSSTQWQNASVEINRLAKLIVEAK